MTNHFVVFPSATKDTGLKFAKSWMDAGYCALVGLDYRQRFDIPECVEFHADGVSHYGAPDSKLYSTNVPNPFPGYYQCIGLMVRKAYELGASLITAAADDMLPPKQGADEHSRLYFARFPNGEGVMQCTGDRQGIDDSGRAASERICGSPTFGEVWYERAFGSGSYGFPQGFFSFYADELIKEVADKMGLLYQEPLLEISHLHWSWAHRPIAEHNVRAQLNWDRDRATFEAAMSDGFSSYLNPVRH